MPLTDGYLIAQGDTNWQFVNTGPGNLSSISNPYTIINGIRAFSQIIEGYGNGKVDYSKPDCLVTDIPEIPFTPNKPASQLSSLAQELAIGYAGIGPQNLSSLNIVWKQPIVLLDPNKITINNVVADCSVLGRVMTISLPAPVAIDGSTSVAVKIEKDAVGAYVTVIDDTVYNVPSNAAVAETAVDTQDTDQASPSAGQAIQAFVSLTADQTFDAVCTHQYQQVSIVNCKGSSPECWQIAMHLWGSTIPLSLFPIDQNIDIATPLDAGYPAVAVEPIEVGETGQVAIVGVSGDPIYLAVDNCGEALIQLGQAITVTSLCGGCVNNQNATVDFIYALPDVEEQIYKPQVRLLTIRKFSEVAIPVAGSITPANFASVNIPLYSNGTAYVTGVGGSTTLYVRDVSPVEINKFDPTNINLTMLTSTLISTETFFFKTDAATSDKIILGEAKELIWSDKAPITAIGTKLDDAHDKWNKPDDPTKFADPNAIINVTTQSKEVSIVTSLTITPAPGGPFKMWDKDSTATQALQTALTTNFITTTAFADAYYKDAPITSFSTSATTINQLTSSAEIPGDFQFLPVTATVYIPQSIGSVTVQVGQGTVDVATAGGSQFVAVSGLPQNVVNDVATQYSNIFRLQPVSSFFAASGACVNNVTPSFREVTPFTVDPQELSPAGAFATYLPSTAGNITKWDTAAPLSVGSANAITSLTPLTDSITVVDTGGTTRTITFITAINTGVGANISVPVLTSTVDFNPITSISLTTALPVTITGITPGTPYNVMTSFTLSYSGTGAADHLQNNGLLSVATLVTPSYGSVTGVAGSVSVTSVGGTTTVATPGSSASINAFQPGMAQTMVTGGNIGPIGPKYPIYSLVSAVNAITAIQTTLSTNKGTVLTALSYDPGTPFVNTMFTTVGTPINLISTIIPQPETLTLVTNVLTEAGTTQSFDIPVWDSIWQPITELTTTTAALLTSTFFSSTSEFYLGSRFITEPTGYTQVNLTSIGVSAPDPTMWVWEAADTDDSLTVYTPDTTGSSVAVATPGGSPISINYSIQTGTVQAIAADAGGPIQLISSIGTGSVVTALINDPAGPIKLVQKDANLQQWGPPGYSPAEACTPGQAQFVPPGMQTFEGDDELYVMAPIPMAQAPNLPIGVAGPTDVPGFTVPELASPVADKPTDVEASGSGFATLQVRRMAHARMFKHIKGC
jgi:bacterioferritin-associated ferredoxin